jgi:hypothetical protein
MLPIRKRRKQVLQRKTALVVGAGASAEFGLPVGSQLRQQIISLASVKTKADLEWGERVVDGEIRRDEVITDAIRKKLAPAEAQAVRVSLKTIADYLYMKNSIDVFLDHNRELDGLVETGKMLIAVSIARAEQNSNIYQAMNWGESEMDFSALSQTWIDSFARILLDVPDPHEIADNFSVICFNYDRCIEFYLIMAIMQTYPGMEFKEAHQIVYEMNIIHPYGTLGKLPGGVRGYGNGTVPFGADLEEQDVWAMTKDLKIFTEREHDETTLTSLRKWIAYSDNLIFMGFGFAPQNMELLNTASVTKQAPRKKIYVTGKGIHEMDEREVQRRISGLFSYEGAILLPRDDALIMRGATCAQLFNANYFNFSS